MEQPLPRVLLDDAIGRFLDHRRALGRGYATEEHILRGVRNFILELGADDLDQKTFECWSARTASLSPNTRRARQRTVRLLCLHRRRTEPECFVPDPLHFARPQPYRPPVLVQPEQIARMLACATSAAPTPNSPLRGAVLRLAVVLLYTAGLRRGEATSLTLGDVDAEAGVVRVRESKFHKSRLVPLSTDAGRELRRYLRTRELVCDDRRPEAPLLCNRSRGWRGYTGTGLRDAIMGLFDDAGVHDGRGRRPRVHDLRHSFAVQALTRLYLRGDDVRSRLPHLALYMGHVSIVSTAHYLHFVPEVAQLASERFAGKCGHLIEEVADAQP